jgi:hypothetical protein
LAMRCACNSSASDINIFAFCLLAKTLAPVFNTVGRSESNGPINYEIIAIMIITTATPAIIFFLTLSAVHLLITFAFKDSII